MLKTSFMSYLLGLGAVATGEVIQYCAKLLLLKPKTK